MGQELTRAPCPECGTAGEADPGLSRLQCAGCGNGYFLRRCSACARVSYVDGLQGIRMPWPCTWCGQFNAGFSQNQDPAAASAADLAAELSRYGVTGGVTRAGAPSDPGPAVSGDPHADRGGPGDPGPVAAPGTASLGTVADRSPDLVAAPGNVRAGTTAPAPGQAAPAAPGPAASPSPGPAAPPSPGPAAPPSPGQAAPAPPGQAAPAPPGPAGIPSPGLAAAPPAARRRRARRVGFSVAAVVASAAAAAALLTTGQPHAAGMLTARAVTTRAVLYTASRVASVDFQGVPGRLVITGTGSGQVTLSGQVRASGAAPSVETHLDRATGALAVSVRCPSAIACTQDLRLAVPGNASTTVRQPGGQVVATGLAGPLDVTAANAEVSVSGLRSASLTAAITNGRLSAAFSVPPRQVAVSLASAQATIRLPARAAYRVTGKFTSGFLKVAVPQASDAARTVTVHISSSELELLPA